MSNEVINGGDEMWDTPTHDLRFNNLFISELPQVAILFGSPTRNLYMPRKHHDPSSLRRLFLNRHLLQLGVPKFVKSAADKKVN